jgi:sec-independent protein translocase protein TatA
MSLGASELFLVLLVILLLFGGKRLPELARNLGRGLSEFRRATQTVQRDLTSTINDVIRDPQTRTPDASPASDKIIPHVNPTSQPRTPQESSGSNP